MFWFHSSSAISEVVPVHANKVTVTSSFFVPVGILKYDSYCSTELKSGVEQLNGSYEFSCSLRET